MVTSLPGPCIRPAKAAQRACVKMSARGMKIPRRDPLDREMYVSLFHRDWAKYHVNEVMFRPRKMTPGELEDGFYRMCRKTY